jgi:hypothetical protein
MCRVLRNRYCGERKPHLDKSSNGSGSSSRPEHLRSAAADPERLLTLLGDLDMDIFEIDQAGGLQGLLGFEGYTRKIGSGYTDLVLLARTRRLRARLKSGA